MKHRVLRVETCGLREKIVVMTALMAMIDPEATGVGRSAAPA